MDQAEADRREVDGLGATRGVGTPNSDGPGNAAYQRMQALLAKVHAEEDARRRRN
jgi:hypothetical protein